ncbi:hypothetical protein AC1031_020463 [Aphanomyces cochlioides]|nr:hypothetical protein AC1031_020463 [Aphanomyces cochlioides]
MKASWEETVLVACVVTFKLIALLSVWIWIWYTQVAARSVLRPSQKGQRPSHLRTYMIDDFSKTIDLADRRRTSEFNLDAKTLHIRRDGNIVVGAAAMADPPSESSFGMQVSDFTHDEDPMSTLARASIAEPVLVQTKIPFQEITFLKKLTSGTYGEVWLGLYQERSVAIKQIRDEYKDDKKEIASFIAEIKLILPLRHANILECLGCSWHPRTQRLCFLAPYIPHGDMYMFLQTSQAQSLTWPQEKIHIAMGLALGILYLHRRHVIHRDLKSKNILLDMDFTPKITDFGISRECNPDSLMTTGVGTPLWTAPEVFVSNKYTESVDVYSFGVILSELDTLQIPFKDQYFDKKGRIDAVRVVKAVVNNQAKPTFLPTCPPSMYELALRCLDHSPQKRPTAEAVVRTLQTIVVPQLVTRH